MAKGNAWHEVEKLLRRVGGKMAIADLTGERRANRDHEHRCAVVEALLAQRRMVDYVEETVSFERRGKCVQQMSRFCQISVQQCFGWHFSNVVRKVAVLRTVAAAATTQTATCDGGDVDDERTVAWLNSPGPRRKRRLSRRVPLVDFNVAGETIFYMLRRDEELMMTFINIVFNVENEERKILAKLAFEHPTQCLVRQSSAMPSATVVAQTTRTSRSSNSQLRRSCVPNTLSMHAWRCRRFVRCKLEQHDACGWKIQNQLLPERVLADSTFEPAEMFFVGRLRRFFGLDVRAIPSANCSHARRDRPGGMREVKHGRRH